MSKTRTRKPVLKPVRPYARLRRETPGEWGPFEEAQIRLPHGYTLFSQYGTPWLMREGKRLPVDRYRATASEHRSELAVAARLWLQSPAGVSAWMERPDHFRAVETLAERLAMELDEGTAAVQWAEADADRCQIDVIERQVA